MQYEVLRELGLDENESKVYLECLKEDGVDVKFISSKSGLIRTTVYGVLKSLMNKGMVSTIDREGIMIFRAVRPKELLNMLDKRREELSMIVPELEKLSLQKSTRKTVDFFEGIRSIEIINNDIISKNDEIVRILGGASKWLQFSSSFTSVYYRKKKERNVKTKTVFTDTKEERTFLKNKKVINSDVRFIKDMDLVNYSIYIYQDKVAYNNYIDPHGFIIQDIDFNKSMNMLFEKIWMLAKK